MIGKSRSGKAHHAGRHDTAGCGSLQALPTVGAPHDSVVHWRQRVVLALQLLHTATRYCDARKHNHIIGIVQNI